MGDKRPNAAVYGTAETRPSAWKVSEDSFLTTARPSARGMWVNILNRWFVMSSEVKTVGECLTVTKRDGSTQEVVVEQIAGTFEDKVIYKVQKD